MVCNLFWAGQSLGLQVVVCTCSMMASLVNGKACMCEAISSVHPSLLRLFSSSRTSGKDTFVRILDILMSRIKRLTRGLTALIVWKSRRTFVISL